MYISLREIISNIPRQEYTLFMQFWWRPIHQMVSSTIINIQPFVHS